MNYSQLLTIDNDIEQIMQELPAIILEVTGIDINNLISEFEAPAE
jgi:hypothetical protein